MLFFDRKVNSDYLTWEQKRETEKNLLKLKQRKSNQIKQFYINKLFIYKRHGTRHLKPKDWVFLPHRVYTLSYICIFVSKNLYIFFGNDSISSCCHWLAKNAYYSDKLTAHFCFSFHRYRKVFFHSSHLYSTKVQLYLPLMCSQ